MSKRADRPAAQDRGRRIGTSPAVGSLPDSQEGRYDGHERPAASARVLDIEAREINKGDDLFGAGVVTSAFYVGGSVRVEYGGTGVTFWPDEVVTVRRGS